MLHALCLLVPLALLPPTPQPAGLGVARVPAAPELPLYLYALASVEQRPGEVAPADSVTFRAGPYHAEVATAPPWFAPEHLKLDYDLLLLRVVTVAHEWLEVVVSDPARASRWDPPTRWVERRAVAFEPWPVFLLGVPTVAPLDQAANLVRTRPDVSAPPLSEAWLPVRPLAVQGDWLLVSTHGLADRIPPTGWLRWRGGGLLLIRYDPLC